MIQNETPHDHLLDSCPSIRLMPIYQTHALLFLLDEHDQADGTQQRILELGVIVLTLIFSYFAFDPEKGEENWKEKRNGRTVGLTMAIVT